MEITKKLNSIYNPMLFATFFIGTAIFVVLGLSVITADNFFVNTTAITHVFATLIYVAVFSYGSQKIMDSSAKVCDEAYNIDKDYIMVIMMAQKKLRFTTYFFEISFETFNIMLSRSWSFISVLNSFV